MKKGIVFLFVIMLLATLSNKENKGVVIPENAIRFRIIANSNNPDDQAEKLTIKKKIEPIINETLNNATTIDIARTNIVNSIGKFENIINNYTTNYKINYGLNYFPAKEYKDVTYPEGNYESLVITLGDGLGDNWWCVLFPPLCLIEGNDQELDNVTYSFFIKDIISKY